MSIDRSFRRSRGISLIELIMFIVVLGVGVAGVLSVYTVAVKNSADPMQRKQAIAIAESLLTEILQQQFTYCDPQDGNVLTATSVAGCASAANDQDKAGAALNAPTPAGETRYSLTAPFDNVADYGGFAKTDIDDITGNNVMAGYNASVSITRVGSTLPQSPVTVPNDAALRIEVTVRYNNDNDAVTLTGYRLRYAPNSAG